MISNIITKAIALLFLSSSPVWAFDLIDINYFDIEYRQYFTGGRNLVIDSVPGKSIDKELALNFNFGLMENTLYWRNTVQALTDVDNLVGDGQFRSIAWSFSLGIPVHKSFEIEYAHKSTHLLDARWAGVFPVQDSIGVRIILLTPDR